MPCHSSEESGNVTHFFSTLSGSVNTLSTMARQVASAAEKQSATAAEIKTSTDHMSAEARQSVAIVSENDTVSQELFAVAAQMKKLVRQFQKG